MLRELRDPHTGEWTKGAGAPVKVSASALVAHKDGTVTGSAGKVQVGTLAHEGVKWVARHGDGTVSRHATRPAALHELVTRHNRAGTGNGGTASPPAPAAAPAGHHYGKVGVTSDTAIPDPAARAAALAEAQHGLDHQGRFVPQIAGRQQVDFTDNLDGKVLGRTFPGPDNIWLLPYDSRAVGNVSKSVNGKTPGRLQKDQQAKGWSVPSDPQYSLVDTTIAHETGHVIAGKVSADRLGNMKLWEPLAKAIGVKPPAAVPGLSSERRASNLDKWVSDNAGAIGSKVSRYGAHSPAELQGELWSEYTMNKSPRGPAKIYGDYVTAALKAQGDL